MPKRVMAYKKQIQVSTMKGPAVATTRIRSAEFAAAGKLGGMPTDAPYIKDTVGQKRTEVDEPVAEPEEQEDEPVEEEPEEEEEPE
jgi:hypothetical protein